MNKSHEQTLNELAAEYAKQLCPCGITRKACCETQHCSNDDLAYISYGRRYK